MSEETPSPARAGRLPGSSSFAVGVASTQSWPVVKRPGNSLQQVERLGQHVVARHRLELGNVERREDRAQRRHAGAAGVAARTGRRLDGVARVEQHGAAALHVGVDEFQRLARRLRRARHDRPVDQRIERELVARRIEPDRLAGLERGALRQEQGEALQAGLADTIDLGIAGDDVGEPCFERRAQRLLFAALRECVRRYGQGCTNERHCESGGRRPSRAANLRSPPASRNTISASSASIASAASRIGPRKSCGSLIR